MLKPKRKQNYPLRKVCFGNYQFSLCTGSLTYGGEEARDRQKPKSIEEG
jgi:hypothetical protein